MGSHKQTALERRRAKMSYDDSQDRAEDRQARVYDVLATEWSHLIGATMDIEQAFYTLKVVYKGPANVLAILQHGDDPQDGAIAFGGGVDLVAALDGLNRSIGGNRWKWDEFRAKYAEKALEE